MHLPGRRADTDRATTIEDDPIHEGIGEDRQVRAFARRRQVGERAIHANAADHVLWPWPDPRGLFGAAVQVGDERKSEVVRRSDEGPIERTESVLHDPEHRHRTRRSMQAPPSGS